MVASSGLSTQVVTIAHHQYISMDLPPSKSVVLHLLRGQQ